MKYTFIRFPEGKTKAVTVSYDDGCREDVKTLNVLNQYGIKGTFNFTGQQKLTEEEIQTLLFDHGHEVAIHTEEHCAPGAVSVPTGLSQVYEGRKALEKQFGRIIRGMAYPDFGIRFMQGGATYEEVRAYVKGCGIAYARTLAGDNDDFRLPSDWYAWMPTAHHNNPNLKEYVEKFVNMDVDHLYASDRYPRLFYLWGHSFEYERNQNWDVLENFCKNIGGKEDTWYATNIEICDYVNACRNLQTSLDGQTVFNPNAIPVWLCKNHKTYKIEPNETVTLDE